MRDQIDNCSFLRLGQLSEPEDNCLRLVLEEMRASEVAEELLVAGTTLGPAYSVDHTEACRVFEITWEIYIAYSVVNESYGLENNGEAFEGSRYRLYTQSRFLEYVRTQTWGDEKHPGPAKHTAIVCEHHIVNVVSVSEPQMRLLKSGRVHAVSDS